MSIGKAKLQRVDGGAQDGAALPQVSGKPEKEVKERGRRRRRRRVRARTIAVKRLTKEQLRIGRLL